MPPNYERLILTNVSHNHNIILGWNAWFPFQNPGITLWQANQKHVRNSPSALFHSCGTYNIYSIGVRLSNYKRIILTNVVHNWLHSWVAWFPFKIPEKSLWQASLNGIISSSSAWFHSCGICNIYPIGVRPSNCENDLLTNVSHDFILGQWPGFHSKSLKNHSDKLVTISNNSFFLSLIPHMWYLQYLSNWC